MEYLCSTRKLVSPEVPAVDSRTLGLAAVEAEDERAYDLLNYELQLANLKLAEHISARKSDPESLPPIARTTGQIAGHTMTDEEAKFVADTRNWWEAAPDIDGLSEQHAAKVQTHLNEVRFALKNLDDRQATQMNQSMTEWGVPYFLGAMKEQHVYDVLVATNDGRERREIGRQLHWAAWLSGYASDLQLLNFLQWHVHQLSEQQVAPELESGINEQKAHYKEALDQGIYDGWLSHKAVGAIKEVDSIRVRFGDVFDTLFREMGGYYFRGSGYVVLAQGVGSERMRRLESAYSSVDHALWHELNHAVLGKRDASAEDTTGGMRERWLDEALTEHINLVLKGLDPRARSSYTAERLLFRTLLSKGSKIIDASVGTRAYSGDTAEQQEFYGVLDESWGANVVPAVSKAITKCENALLAEGIKLRLAQTRAVEKVTDKLINNPRAIFGAEWVRPGKLEVMAA